MPEPPPTPPPTSPRGRPRITWRRLTRSRRGAAGLGAVAAALLLWPFSGFSWIPWLAGLAALVVLRLLRLDGLLKGWDLPLAGLVVVVGLMLSTGPWAWALAAGIGVLLAGLAQLPAWRLAAVGAVLSLAAGVGFGVSLYTDRSELTRQQAEASRQTFGLFGERRPERVFGALVEGIVQGDLPGVCGLLDDRAEQDFVRAAGAADCAAAVAAFHQAVPPTLQSDDVSVPAVQDGDRWLIDACRTGWARPLLGGPSLGELEVRRSAPPGGTYFIAAFSPCDG
ncbi:hypothetical protein [Pseudonocardia nigra]|uniref:hypothetical protein n=1 Tax=Pseudonocardia nigra TaxID=1921578 RepID=UPI001C5D7779|nr:hypothetical protein [Pseudonocardia nigra]